MSETAIDGRTGKSLNGIARTYPLRSATSAADSEASDRFPAAIST
jgi:hypothetical protein